MKFEDKIPWTKLHDALLAETGQDLSYDKIRQALRKHPSYKAGIVYEDKKEYSPADVENYLQTVLSCQKAGEKLNTKQVKATVEIDDDKPIGIGYWGDWHIGNKGTDYDSIEDYADKINNTDGLYWIGAGDYKDNYISDAPKGGNFEALIPPGMQDLFVMRYMDKCGEKNIALVRGCHDSWDKKSGDKDFIQTICERINSINLWHGGDLSIKLGDQKYLWRCRHKYKFESGLNVENSMRRINEMKGPCDVAAVAHLHDPYYMKRHFMGEWRVLLRTGSHKVWDEYGQQIAGYKGKIGMPVIIMYPDKRQIIPMLLDDAIEYLNAVR